jgi:hypothetical protein
MYCHVTSKERDKGKDIDVSTSIGFFTVATGDEHYYKIARNLLRSYRHFTKNTLPFAILADRENAYTREFDRTILLDSPTNSYLDKLKLYEYLPYDISVFIDADCLAYGDLNEIFEHFREADDFCCYGRVLPLEDQTGWFNYADLGELQSRVSYCVGLHGGIYYIRRSEKAAAVFDTAREIAADYKKYNFKGHFSTPGDEPILALSMALQGCRPIPFHPEGICCYWEYEGGMDLNVKSGVARIRKNGQRTHLVHWGTRFTRGLLYQKQVAGLELCRSGQTGIPLALSNGKYNGKITLEKAQKLITRVRNKLNRMIGRGNK